MRLTMVASSRIGIDLRQHLARQAEGLHAGWNTGIDRQLDQRVLDFLARAACSALAARANNPAAVRYWHLNADVSGHFSPQDTIGIWLLTSTRLSAEADADHVALVKGGDRSDYRFEIREASI